MTPLLGGSIITATGQSGRSNCGLVLGGWVYKQACLEFVVFEVFLIAIFVFPLPLYTISPVFERACPVGGWSSKLQDGQVGF